MRVRRAALIAIAVAAMLVAGCGSNGGPPANASNADGVHLYGVDGNMDNSLGAGFKTAGAISGMVGTVPLTPLSEDFKQRLLAVDPTLTGFEYSGESYDATVLAALAVQLAHTTDPLTVAKYINGVTALVPGGVECDTIKECLDGIAAGKDIAYRGVTIRSGFTADGEPSTTSYGTLHFGPNNKIDDGKTEFVSAGDEALAAKAAPPAPPAPQNGKTGHDTLKLGLLLPKTGDLSAEGPPMFAGARLAIKEINQLGGILGHLVTEDPVDDGTDPAKSSVAFDKLVADGVGIIVGPSTSGESAALIPKAVATGRVLISTSATAASLSKADDHGLFFRVSPSDSYQAQALSDILMRAGTRRVYLATRDNPYGTGLRDGIIADLVKAGFKKLDIGGSTYKEDQKDYSEIVTGVKSFQPDSVVFIGYGEAAQIITALIGARVQIAH
jgi:ABC-type branched-subunit amino acid transport system substrate-binding protein